MGEGHTGLTIADIRSCLSLNRKEYTLNVVQFLRDCPWIVNYRRSYSNHVMNNLIVVIPPFEKSWLYNPISKQNVNLRFAKCLIESQWI